MSRSQICSLGVYPKTTQALRYLIDILGYDVSKTVTTYAANLPMYLMSEITEGGETTTPDELISASDRIFSVCVADGCPLFKLSGCSRGLDFFAAAHLAGMPDLLESYLFQCNEDGLLHEVFSSLIYTRHPFINGSCSLSCLTLMSVNYAIKENKNVDVVKSMQHIIETYSTKL